MDGNVSLVTMTPLKYTIAEPCFPLYYEETVIVIPYPEHVSDINVTSPFLPKVINHLYLRPLQIALEMTELLK